MSLSNDRGGVDASRSGRASESGGRTGKISKVVLESLRLSPRRSRPYDFQKDFLADPADCDATEDRRGAARDAYLADDEDAEPLPSLGSRYGDAGIEDDARVLAQEDDPDYCPAPVEDDGFEAWNRTVWSQATKDDKKKARGLKHGDQFAGATCYLLVLARAGLSEAARKKRAALDSICCENTTQVGAKHDQLLLACERLDEWIEEHRPELSGYEFCFMLNECRPAALEQLAELDAKYGIGGGCVKPHAAGNEEESPVQPGAGPDTSGWLDMPAQLYRDEYKGRMMVVFGWVPFIVNKRMHEKDMPQQAYKSMGNLFLVMGQVLYWYEPQDDQGTPRAAGKQRRHFSGLGWLVRWNVHRLSKQTGLSRSAVRSAGKRLMDLGLIRLLTNNVTQERWVRVCAENFLADVTAWVASHPKKKPTKGKKPNS